MVDKVTIEGIPYENAKVAAAVLEIPYSTLRSRLESGNSKWEGWHRSMDAVECKVVINGMVYRDLDRAIADLCVLKIRIARLTKGDGRRVRKGERRES